MPPFNTVPGLVPLKIYSGSTLLTTNVNLINFTGSGVTTTVNAFNGLTVNIGGGSTVNTGSFLITASFLNPNLTFTKGDGSIFNVNLVTLVPNTASYALTASYVTNSNSSSYAISASYALSSSYSSTSSVAISASYAPVFPYTGSAQITGSLGVTGSVSLRSGSNLTVNNGLILASYGTDNLSVGGTPGWTSALRNTSIGLLSQGSVITQTGNVSVGYLSLLGGSLNTAIGTLASQYNTGEGNTSVGYAALGNKTSTGTYNIALGYAAMFNASGSGISHNIGIGYVALRDSLSSNNIGIGQAAGYQTTSGYNNTFLGYYAGSYNTTGYENIAIGYSAGLRLVGGVGENVLIGTNAGGYSGNGVVTMGNGNVGIGYNTLGAISSSVGGYPGNVAIGFRAGEGISTGGANIALGFQAGLGIGNGGSNIYLGYNASIEPSTIVRSSNIGIGTFALQSNVSGSYNIAIGSSALSAAGVAGAGGNNIAIGYNAGTLVTAGIKNVFIGNESGTSNGGNPAGSSSYNTFVGDESAIFYFPGTHCGNYNVGLGYGSFGRGETAGYLTDPGDRNTGLGSSTLSKLSSSAAVRNTAVGSNSGNTITSGGNNTLVGAYSGYDLLTGNYNIFLGDSAGRSILSGSNNTIIGQFSSSLGAGTSNLLIIGAGSAKKIQIDSSNMFVGGLPGFTTGLRNTAIGLSSQGSVTTQTDNTSLGYLSLLGGTYNTAVGAYASQFNTGVGNVAMGYYALGNQISDTSYNVAIGFQAMSDTSGSSLGNLYNIGIGYQALTQTRNQYNIGIGYRAGYRLTTAVGTVALGFRAGENIGTGEGNVAIGYSAGLNISGSDTYNVMIGQVAGGSVLGNQMGQGNIGIGFEALTNISASAGSAPYNVAIGFQAGRGVTTGGSNIVIGSRAGYSIGKGNSNIYMGADSGLASTSLVLNYNIGIGSQTFNQNVSASSNIAIGVGALNVVGATTNGSNYGNANIAIGTNAGNIVKTGVANVFIGYESGMNNSGNPVGNGSYTAFIGHRAGMIQGNNGDWGDYSIGIGAYAMGYNGGVTPVAPGIGNTALGALTLTYISSSATTRNTAAGYRAGIVLLTGANNTLIGSYSGQNLSTGSNNIMLGDSAGSGIVSGSNNTIIGSITGLTASLDNTLIIGAGSTQRIRIDSAGNGSWTGSLSVTAGVTGSFTGSINGAVVDNLAWTSYTPAWSTDGVTQPTLGNGTITGTYKVIGKTCFVRVKLAYGSTTTSGTGAFQFSLPVSASTSWAVQFPCSILDNGNSWYQATVNGEYGGFTSKTAIIGQSSGANSSQGITGVFPFTFGNLDSIQFAGSYETA